MGTTVIFIGLFLIFGFLVFSAFKLVGKSTRWAVRIGLLVLILAPVVYFNIHPINKECFRDNECRTLSTGCCGGCGGSMWEKGVFNHRFYEFKQRLTFCWLLQGKICPLVDCMGPSQLSEFTKESACIKNRCEVVEKPRRLLVYGY